MAYTTIDDPSAFFQTTLYTGDGGGTRAVTHGGNSDLNADWVWIKDRGTTSTHYIFDSVRGVQKHLSSASTSQELSDANSLKAFNSDSFTLGTSGNVNGNTRTFVSWNWKESVTAGFDILTYEGTDSARTVAHNLGVKPDWIIVKNIDSSDPPFNWRSYHSALGAGIAMKPNGTDAVSTAADYWNDTEPTSSVFSVKDSGETNNSSQTYIAYLFAEKQGYSKFSSYIGNGNADGTFIYTGFAPAFILLKRTDATDQWIIKDNKRPGHNPNNTLYGNLNNAEDTSSSVYADFVSNGVKLRGANNAINTSGGTYIYLAFAENPFVTSTGIPSPAR